MIYLELDAIRGHTCFPNISFFLGLDTRWPAGDHFEITIIRVWKSGNRAFRGGIALIPTALFFVGGGGGGLTIITIDLTYCSHCIKPYINLIYCSPALY